MYAIHGKDDLHFNDDNFISWGGNIFVSNMLRYDSHGHVIGQGLKTRIIHGAASVSFLINPKNNMNISAGVRMRDYSNDQQDLRSTMFTLAFRTSLNNFYYNF